MIIASMHMRELSSFTHVGLFATPWTVAHQAPRPWDSPGKNTGVGRPFLLQGIFPILGLKLRLLCLLLWQEGSLPLCNLGNSSPYITTIIITTTTTIIVDN